VSGAGNDSDANASVAPVTRLGKADANGDTLPMVLLHKGDRPRVKAVPASRWRDWMNATGERHPNRCLPLLMANQAGWVLLNPAPFTATWDGGDTRSALEVEYADETPESDRVASSHFGSGIVTFGFGDVICTPPGYNLWVRGPTNSPKDGICALDGLVETDWSAAPFTMNWKFTRPGTVAFERDEPFCHIMPQPRGMLERFRPEIVGLESEPELAERVGAWEAHRAMVFLAGRSMFEAGDERWRHVWFQDYFKGRAPTGESSPEHQTTMRLAPFAEDASADGS
jgi:hypothetical protein